MDPCVKGDHDRYYRVLCARDRRFDGLFFVGVKTTGIYCRPICPARTPRRDRCEFFRAPAEAEVQGYRACFRCRPELAPKARLGESSSIAQLRRELDAGLDAEVSIAAASSELGFSARHVRRLFVEAYGITPVQYRQTVRYATAKQLLQDTALSVSTIAFASGFASLRRFNHAFKAQFGMAPTALKCKGAQDKQEPFVAAESSTRDNASDKLQLRLDFRTPLAFAELLGFLRDRTIAGVDQVIGETYQRVVVLGTHVGVIEVRQRSESSLELSLSHSLLPCVGEVIQRVRTLFDLDANPQEIDRALAVLPAIGESLALAPGTRVPGAFDPFETAVRAVLGQQISVAAARTLAGRLAARFGSVLRANEASSDDKHGICTQKDEPNALTTCFPTAEVLAEAGVDAIASIGLPQKRAQTLKALAELYQRGFAVRAMRGPHEAIIELQNLAGIGPWTAQYLAMRALHWPDAFPASDLGVLKALGIDARGKAGGDQAEALVECVRPWRSYAVMHLWQSRSFRAHKPQAHRVVQASTVRAHKVEAKKQAAKSVVVKSTKGLSKRPTQKRPTQKPSKKVQP
jgi:AraC family transcriptional regulator, regulatory protein of adaptative response / DNA-3-methyladenine glycosylase II